MTSSLRRRPGPVVPFLGAPVLVGTLSLALLGGAAWAAPVQPAAAPAPASTELSLSATGEVEVAPDIAVLQMGVSAQAATGAEAIRLNRERMNAALTTLTPKQAEYIGVSTDGPYKTDTYRY